MAPRIHAVILAGGAGERFWPASRERHPKPFMEIFDGQSLLGATHARAEGFAAADDIWVVCGKDHAAGIRKVTGLPASRVLVEPMRRNTTMALGRAILPREKLLIRHPKASRRMELADILREATPAKSGRA